MLYILLQISKFFDLTWVPQNSFSSPRPQVQGIF